MAPLPPEYRVSCPTTVPIILLGEVLANSHAAGPPERSEWTGRLTQLWTVRVRVEAVLQGEVQPQNVDIFYFPDMDPGGGSGSRVMGDLYAGHSELFFLEPDAGRLRTVCDGWRYCIPWVRTGSHDHFRSNPGSPIETNITNLLLSRGDKTTDHEMLDAIYHMDSRWGSRPLAQALKQLSSGDPSPVVRAAAAEKLKEIVARPDYGLCAFGGTLQ